MMKILFTVADANLRGGTEILAFNLLHELNADGVECQLLSVVPYRGDDPLVVSFEGNDYDQWMRMLTNPLNKLRGCCQSDAFLCQLISAKVDELGAEWIINHTYDMSAAIPTDGRWKTAQVFNWSIRGYESSLERIIKNKGVVGRLLSMIGLNAQKHRWHKALPSYTKLVLLTDAAHLEIKEICPLVKDEQLVTIPDPLMQKEDSDVLTTLHNKNVVFVGRLSHEKGVMRLLRIWERIHNRLSDYTLSIYGSGDVRNEMEAFIADRNIEGVKFMGFCNDLAQIYTHADLLLMTSDSEGFGMVLIEAMYYGVPCITFDCPVSPKEIIADAGLAIPCFDEEHYSFEVIKLLRDSERMKMLQQNAVKRAGEYYIDKLINLWKNVVE